MRSRSQFSWNPASAGAKTNISPAITASTVIAKSLPARLFTNAHTRRKGPGSGGVGAGGLVIGAGSVYRTGLAMLLSTTA